MKFITDAILHTHMLVVILFLLLFLMKAVMLFLNKQELLQKARAQTKALDIVFGTLILLSGGFLVFNYNGPLPNWLMVKVALVMLAIPLAIVGLKRGNKVLTALSVLIFFYVYGVAETKSVKMRPDKGEAVVISPNGTVATQPHTSKAAGNPIMAQLEGTQLDNTKAIYANVCANCHSEDGQKGMSGAANLQESELNVEARKAVISNGKGLMPGFGSQLSEQEIEALANYTTMLKK